MAVVYKYKIPTEAIRGSQIEIPEGWVFRSAYFQDGVLFVWVECDPKAPLVMVKFWVVMTGSNVPCDVEFLGTAHMSSNNGRFVAHLYTEMIIASDAAAEQSE